MEEAITSTVLWAWIVGCSIWAWNQQRQARGDYRHLSLRQVRSMRAVGRGLFGVLLVALAVIMLYWMGLPTRPWLLPISALDQPILNQLGLLIIRVAVCWVVITTVQRERSYRLGWRKQQALSSKRQRYPQHYYNQQLVLAGGGLLLGLFLALSSVITGALCLTGWWFGWRLWHVKR